MSKIETLKCSVRLPEELPQELLDIFAGLFLDLIPLIFKKGALKLSSGPKKSAGGAENLVFVLRFDAKLFDQEIRAAFRAVGFDLDAIHGHPSSGSYPETVAPMAPGDNENRGSAA